MFSEMIACIVGSIFFGLISIGLMVSAVNKRALTNLIREEVARGASQERIDFLMGKETGK